MRQVDIKVPRGEGESVLSLASEYNATNMHCQPVTSSSGEWELVRLHISNEHLGPLIKQLDARSHNNALEIAFQPANVIPLRAPLTELNNQAIDLSLRSPVEVWLNALQSIGSWTGFIGYACAAGVTAWIGMYTNSVILLLAAMLIAPFAGPAMSVALASAHGNRTLLGRNLLRYGTGIALTTVTAALFSAIFNQQVPTNMMLATAQVSAVAVLLPLVSGAAGALNLVESENSSLVSGSAVGVLVAAALAPPAALIGMSLVLADWEMAANAGFLLLLQLVGINLSGAFVFWLVGIRPSRLPTPQTNRTMGLLSLGASALILAALMYMQFRSTPYIQRDSIAHVALQQVREEVESASPLSLVDANVTYAQPPEIDVPTLLAIVYVQPDTSEEAVGGQPLSDAEEKALRERVRNQIQERLGREYPNTVPLVTVTILQPPNPPNQ